MGCLEGIFGDSVSVSFDHILVNFMAVTINFICFMHDTQNCRFVNL